MEWLELHIDTNHAGLEPLEIFLSANGVDGVVIDDEQDFQSFLENNHQYWDYVDEDLEASMKGKSRITFYLPADDEGFARLGALRTALQTFKEAHAGQYGSLLMTMENLKDSDWENNWKQYYKPFTVGEKLAVTPDWEIRRKGPPDFRAGPDLRHRQPRHHPPVPHSSGAGGLRRGKGPRPWLRQRHFVHRCPDTGRRLRRRCGY